MSVLPYWFIPLLLPLHLVGTSNSKRLWAPPRLIRPVLKMPFFCLAMLDALALGLLLTMSELLSLVFATMGFTVRIQWYHHFHTLIMGHAFIILFICFVTYEERLMRPPHCHLNRSRLRPRSIPHEVSSSHLTRHQSTTTGCHHCSPMMTMMTTWSLCHHIVQAMMTMMTCPGLCHHHHKMMTTMMMAPPVGPK